MTAIAQSRPSPHSLSPAGWRSILLIAFGYAAYGVFAHRAASAPETSGAFPWGTLVVSVICDPLFASALLFAWCLVAARRAGEMTSSEMVIRAGRHRSLLTTKLIPWAIGASTLVWLSAFAVVFLVTLGSWATAGFPRSAFAADDATLLAWQFAGGVLVFTIFAVLIDISAMTSPERLRFALPTLVAMAAWVILFTSNFLGDRLPESLRAIHVLTAAASGGELTDQLGRLASFALALMFLSAGVALLDRVSVRRRALPATVTTDPLLVIAVSAALTAAIVAAGPFLVSELFGGYRGSLVGALVEAALTVAPAAATWVALESRGAVGWAEAQALRTGTRSRAFTRRLRYLFARCVAVWSLIAIGSLLGIVATRQPLFPAHDVSAIIAFSLAGGLVQTLVYVTLIHFVSQFARSDAFMTVFVVLLVVLPPPGTSVPILPLHRAFDGLLVIEDPVAAFISLAGLCLGLTLILIIAVGTLAAMDRSRSRRMANAWRQQCRPVS
jgi:uncharacterized membrane protein YpjA